jgi:hypothetical protein
MAFLKHIGRLTTNNRKVVVAYRVLPDDSENALIVTTENLNADEHDSLMKLVESPSGQQSYELAEAMARTRLSDGRNMLAGFHTTGKLVKVPQNIVKLTPTNSDTIMLDELNRQMAEQKGVTVAELALSDSGTSSTPTEKEAETVATAEPVAAPAEEGVLSDEDLAAQYRSQADAMFKEAKRLREQAEELVPTKKKSTAKKTESA